MRPVRWDQSDETSQMRPVRWDQSDMLCTFSDHQMKPVRSQTCTFSDHQMKPVGHVVPFLTTKYNQSDTYLLRPPNEASQTCTFSDHQMKPVRHVHFQTTKWSQSDMYRFRPPNETSQACTSSPPNEASQTCCTFSDYQIKPVRHVPFQTTKWSQSDMYLFRPPNKACTWDQPAMLYLFRPIYIFRSVPFWNWGCIW